MTFWAQNWAKNPVVCFQPSFYRMCRDVGHMGMFARFPV